MPLPYRVRIPALNLTWRFALTAVVLGVVLALALNFVLGRVIARQALAAAKADVTDIVARQLLLHMSPDDFTTPMTGERLEEFDRYVEQRVLSSRALRVKLWSPSGDVIYSDDRKLIGTRFPFKVELKEALDGHVQAEVEEPSAEVSSEPENVSEVGFGKLIEVYAPLTFAGMSRPSGVFEVYEAYAPVASALADMGRNLVAGLAVGLLMIYVALLRVVHGGTRVIRTQASDLGRRASDLEAANLRLVEREERFRSLVENASDVLLVVDGEGTVTYAGPSIASLWGYPVEEVEGSDAYDMVHSADCEGMRNALITCPAGGHRTVQFRVRHRGGQWLQIEAVATNLLGNVSVAGIVLNCHDITERARFEQQLVDQAFHDPLTGLPNRALFVDRIDHALVTGEKTGTVTGVMFLDLDRFKVVNDSLGHALGDQLLIAVSQRLTNAARPQDTVARMGGDEFAVVLPNIKDGHDAVLIGNRILEALQHPLSGDLSEHIVTASIGVAVGGGPLDTAGARDLLRNADVAMYDAKAQGGSCVSLFDPSRDTFSVDRLGLEDDLRQAIDRAELRLHYQPSVDLESGQVVALEALVRWQHPTRGLLSPDAFIPLAMETGDIVSIGRWVMREACTQAQAWQDYSPVLMRVNLSAVEFEQPDLLDWIRGMLDDTRLQPQHLEIEITETILLRDSAAVIERLDALKRLGVRLAIDDFGTGYSSLSYLTSLPVDTLKIDRSFISALEDDEKTAPIIRAIMMVGAAMDLTVTAEGIETPAQLEYLQRVKCSEGQGFYFARPLEAGRATTLLESGLPFGVRGIAAA